MRRVKEEDAPVTASDSREDKLAEYALKSDLTVIQEAQEALRKDVDRLLKRRGKDDDESDKHHVHVYDL